MRTQPHDHIVNLSTHYNVSGESLANSFNSRYSRHSYEGVGAGPGGTRRSKQSEVREW